MNADLTRRAVFTAVPASVAACLPVAAQAPDTTIADVLQYWVDNATPYFNEKTYAVIKRSEIEALLAKVRGA